MKTFIRVPAIHVLLLLFLFLLFHGGNLITYKFVKNHMLLNLNLVKVNMGDTLIFRQKEGLTSLCF